MWLVVGLGNPGRRYEGTRHNIGFEVLDELQRRHMQSSYRSKFGGETVNGLIGSQQAILLKPMEFMNNSGFAVQRACQFHNVEMDKVVVVHDELDLPPAQLRLKKGGGHGGNNGLRSIIDQNGSRDFLRVRFGIGKPQKSDGSKGEGSGAGYVLSPFPAEIANDIAEATKKAADAVEKILADGISTAMNEFNTNNNKKNKSAKKQTEETGGVEQN